ncbi:MAG: hypothetical protein JWQ87_4871 [Candidatus Sulfotelmatobacter sp.]|nr:hypothetical protein [Candidatus Sulfotelmatobacter sp.]
MTAIEYSIFRTPNGNATFMANGTVLTTVSVTPRGINLGAAMLSGQARHACNGIFHSEVEFQLAITDVAVEKLICGKRSQITSRQDALQTIFSGRLGIFYLSILKKSRRFLSISTFSTPTDRVTQRTRLSDQASEFRVDGRQTATYSPELERDIVAEGDSIRRQE